MSRSSMKSLALLVLAVATATTAAFTVTGSTPADADPAQCNSWTLNADVSVRDSAGLRVAMTWAGKAPKTGPRTAQLFLPDGTPAQINDGKPAQHGDPDSIFPTFTSNQLGTVTGGVDGSNIHFDIAWDGTNPPLSTHYTGTINQFGGITNGLEVNNNGDKNTWGWSDAFQCDQRPNPGPSPAPAPFQEFATVIGGDADVFDIAHDDVPDATTGVRGAKIGTLTNGSQVYLGTPCAQGWCRVNNSQIKTGFGFVEQAHLQIN
jgi:hypothetical protein